MLRLSCSWILRIGAKPDEIEKGPIQLFLPTYILNSTIDRGNAAPICVALADNVVCPLVCAGKHHGLDGARGPCCCIWERLLPLSASARTRRRVAAHPLWHRAERTAADSLALKHAPCPTQTRSFDLVALWPHWPYLWGKLIGLYWSHSGGDSGGHGGQSAGPLARGHRDAGVRSRSGNPVCAGGAASRPCQHVPAPPASLYHLPFVHRQRDPHLRGDLAPLRSV